jgi:TolA-binding protein
MADKTNEKKPDIERKLNLLVLKRRKQLIILGIAVVLVVAAVGITSALVSQRTERLTAEAELLQERYNELAGGASGLEAEEVESALAELKEETEAFLQSAGRGYARLRALYLKASISYRLGSYEEAAAEYLEAAELYSDSHLAAPAHMNAAVSFERAGNTADALTQYEKVYNSFKDSSPEAPHAMFSAARLLETLDRKGEAAQLYRELSTAFPDSDWAKLGVSRLIVIE